MMSEEKNGRPNRSRDVSRSAIAYHATLFGFVVLTLCVFAMAGLADPRRMMPEALAQELERVLAPYAARAGETLKISLNNSAAIYHEGDYFVLEVEALGDTDFIYVDYFLLDGSVVHILPSPARSDNRLRAGQRVFLGDPDGDVIYDVLPPFGREMLVVTAAGEPLFSEERNEVEPGLAYLLALQAGLTRAATRSRPTAVLQAIETYPAGQQMAGRATVQGVQANVADRNAPARPPETPRESTDHAGKTADRADRGTIDALDPNVPSARTAAPEDSGPTSYYLASIAPRLARMAEHPEDDENVVKLAAAYGTYAQRLREVGEFAKARRTVDLARALDPNSSELAALYPEVERDRTAQDAFEGGLRHLKASHLLSAFEAFLRALKAKPDHAAARRRVSQISADATALYMTRAREAYTRGDFAAAAGTWSKILSMDPGNETARANLRRAEEAARDTKGGATTD